MARKAVCARITGRVQGVWFRAWTVENAQGLGLSGWVRNRRDGGVEALFAGEAEAVDEMLLLCHDGPPHAKVDAVEPAPADDPGDTGFTMARTG